MTVRGEGRGWSSSGELQAALGLGPRGGRCARRGRTTAGASPTEERDRGPVHGHCWCHPSRTAPETHTLSHLRTRRVEKRKREREREI